MELICTNGKRLFGAKFTSYEFCLPFTQTVNRPVCPNLVPWVLSYPSLWRENLGTRMRSAYANGRQSRVQCTLRAELVLDLLRNDVWVLRKSYDCTSLQDAICKGNFIQPWRILTVKKLITLGEWKYIILTTIFYLHLLAIVFCIILFSYFRRPQEVTRSPPVVLVTR